jgi:hypothetical protein
LKGSRWVFFFTGGEKAEREREEEGEQLTRGEERRKELGSRLPGVVCRSWLPVTNRERRWLR